MRPIDGDELYVKLKDAGMVFALHMVESAPTIASPPNDPLTLEDLRELDGEPVWDNLLKTWGLVVGDHILYRNGEKLRICGNAYRRKPEEGKELQNSEEKPRCFYNDNGSEWCLGMAPEDMDEPIERCKRCTFFFSAASASLRDKILSSMWITPSPKPAICESGYSAEEGAK